MSATALGDQFSGLFGESRGGAGRDGGARASRYEMPRCPKGAHRELVAIDLRPWQGSTWWEAGWYGSELSLSFHLDDQRPALWTRHYRSLTREPRPLCDKPHAYSHMFLAWEALPEAVKERIVAEVERGLPERCSATNDDPLNPF